MELDGLRIMSKIYPFEWDPADSGENEIDLKKELSSTNRSSTRKALACTGIIALTVLAFMAVARLGRV